MEKVLKRDFDHRYVPTFEDGQWWKGFFENKYNAAKIKQLIAKAAAFEAEDAEMEEQTGKGEQQDSDEEDEERMCGVCGKVFASLQQLNSHRSLAHAWRHPAVDLAKSGRSVCQRCKIQFWTPTRLAAHLKVYEECLAFEGQCQPCEDRAEVEARVNIEGFSQCPPVAWLDGG